LRAILAENLAETRGVVAVPEQIIVTASARGATSLIATALLEEGDAVWVEEPGFQGPKTLFAAAGAALIPVAVDDQGIAVTGLGALPAPRLIYTTPSHQYPTGAIMRLSRRLELLELAARANAYVIEDDYDSEFQYRGRPIAALQGLDRAGCVLYLGTFSKSLLPSLRLGFLVAPGGLAEKLVQVHRNTGQLVPPIIQLAAADFIERGHYRAHVRRMRSLYAERLEVFSDLIHEHSGGRMKAALPDGGMQTVVRSLEGKDDAALLQHLGLAGIDGHPLSGFHLTPERASRHGVLMGFSAWPEAEIRRVLSGLTKLRVS
jgi:GntR family transcriptional regulator/MocR family aminotransferase